MSRKFAGFRPYLVIFILVAGPIFGQDDLVGKEVENPKTGIFKLQDLNVKFFEMSDASRPRIGNLIELSKVDDTSRLDNFRFCDGTTERVDLTKLVESTRSCGKLKLTNTLDFSAISGDNTIPIFFKGLSGDIGSIVAISASDSGGYIGIVEFSQAWRGVAQVDSVKPKDLVNIGREGIEESGYSNQYTDSDLQAILKMQAKMGIKPAPNSNVAYNLGEGTLVGVNRLVSKSTDFSQDIKSILKPDIGVQFSF